MRREFLKRQFLVSMTHAEMARRATNLACYTTPENVRWQKAVFGCDLLMIDDLGKSHSVTQSGVGKAHEEFLFDLISYRQAHALSCVFTANLDSDGLAKAFSEERSVFILRRLREMCRKTAVNFDV
jgi:DNA replication protein DnaC